MVYSSLIVDLTVKLLDKQIKHKITIVVDFSSSLTKVLRKGQQTDGNALDRDASKMRTLSGQKTLTCGRKSISDSS